MQDIKLEKIKIAEIIPYINNQKKHPTDQVEKIMSSIKEFGIVNPLIIDKENVLIAGHGRYEALKRLNYDEVAVIRAEHLTPAQVKAYRIADNRLAEFGEWDEDLLKLEFIELEEMGFNYLKLDFDFKLDIPTIDEVEEIDPDLPSGDREQIQSMSFVVSDEQHEIIEKAIKEAKEFSPDDPMGINKNKNGNALFYVCEFFLNNNKGKI